MHGNNWSCMIRSLSSPVSYSTLHFLLSLPPAHFHSTPNIYISSLCYICSISYSNFYLCKLPTPRCASSPRRTLDWQRRYFILEASSKGANYALNGSRRAVRARPGQKISFTITPREGRLSLIYILIYLVGQCYSVCGKCCQSWFKYHQHSRSHVITSFPKSNVWDIPLLISRCYRIDSEIR